MRGSKRKVWIAGAALITAASIVLLVAWRHKAPPTSKAAADGDRPAASTPAQHTDDTALRVARAAERKHAGATGDRSAASAPDNSGLPTSATPPVSAAVTPKAANTGMGKGPSRTELEGHLARARVRVGKLDKVLARVSSKASALQLQQIRRQRDYYAQAVQHLTQKLASMPAQAPASSATKK